MLQLQSKICWNSICIIGDVSAGFVSKVAVLRGIFGHLASSKEEVLKMRGPMSANEYEAVPGDDLDLRVQYFARP